MKHLTPTESVMRHVLQRARTIAIVGASQSPERHSHVVARYLAHEGYVGLNLQRAASAAESRKPFREWLSTLDVVARARVQARVPRLPKGGLAEDLRDPEFAS